MKVLGESNCLFFNKRKISNYRTLSSWNMKMNPKVQRPALLVTACLMYRTLFLQTTPVFAIRMDKINTADDTEV